MSDDVGTHLDALASNFERTHQIFAMPKMRLMLMKQDILQHTLLQYEILDDLQRRPDGMKRVKVTSGKEFVLLPTRNIWKSQLRQHVWEGITRKMPREAIGGEFRARFTRAADDLFKPARVSKPSGVPAEEFERDFPYDADKWNETEFAIASDDDGDSSSSSDDSSSDGSSDSSSSDDDDEDRVPRKRRFLETHERDKPEEKFNLKFNLGEFQNIQDTLLRSLKILHEDVKRGRDPSNDAAPFEVITGLLQILETKAEMIEMLDAFESFVFGMITQIDLAFQHIESPDTTKAQGTRIVVETVRKLEALSESSAPEEAAGEWTTILTEFNRFVIYAQLMTKQMRDTWKVIINPEASDAALRRAWKTYNNIWRRLRFSFVALIMAFESMFLFLTLESGITKDSSQHKAKKHDSAVWLSHSILMDIKRTKGLVPTTETPDAVDEDVLFTAFLERGRRASHTRAVLASHGIKFPRKSEHRSFAEVVVLHAKIVWETIKAMWGATVWVVHTFHQNRLWVMGFVLVSFSGLYFGGAIYSGITVTNSFFWDAINITMITLCNMIATPGTGHITGSVGVYMMYTFFEALFSLVMAIPPAKAAWDALVAAPYKLLHFLFGKCVNTAQMRAVQLGIKTKGCFKKMCCGWSCCQQMSTEEATVQMADSARMSSEDVDIAFKYWEPKAQEAAIREIEAELATHINRGDIGAPRQRQWWKNMPFMCKGCARTYFMRIGRKLDMGGITAWLTTVKDRVWFNRYKVTGAILGISSAGFGLYVIEFWKWFAHFFCTMRSETNAILGGIDPSQGLVYTARDVMAMVALRAEMTTTQRLQAVVIGLRKAIFESSAIGEWFLHSSLSPVNLGLLPILSGIVTTKNVATGTAVAAIEVFAPAAVSYVREHQQRLQEHDARREIHGDPRVLGAHPIMEGIHTTGQFIQRAESDVEMFVNAAIDIEITEEETPAAGGAGLPVPEESRLVPVPEDPDAFRVNPFRIAPEDMNYHRKLINVAEIPNSATLHAQLAHVADDPELRAALRAQNLRAIEAPMKHPPALLSLPHPDDLIDTDEFPSRYNTSSTDVVEESDTDDDSGGDDFIVVDDDDLPPALMKARQALQRSDNVAFQNRGTGLWNRFLKTAGRILSSQPQVSAEVSRVIDDLTTDDIESFDNILDGIMHTFVETEFREQSFARAGAQDTGTLYFIDANGIMQSMFPSGTIRLNRAAGTMFHSALDHLGPDLLQRFRETYGTTPDRLATGGYDDAIRALAGTQRDTSYPISHTISAAECKHANIFCAVTRKALEEQSLFPDLAEMGVYVVDGQGMADAFKASSLTDTHPAERALIGKRIIEIAKEYKSVSTDHTYSKLFNYVLSLRRDHLYTVYKDGSWSAATFYQLSRIGRGLDYASALAANTARAAATGWREKGPGHAHLYQMPDKASMTDLQYYAYHATNALNAFLSAFDVPLSVIHTAREQSVDWILGTSYTLKELFGFAEFFFDVVFGKADVVGAFTRLRKLSTMSRFFWHLENKMRPKLRQIRHDLGSIEAQLLNEYKHTIVLYSGHRRLSRSLDVLNIQRASDEQLASAKARILKMMVRSVLDPARLRNKLRKITAEQTRRKSSTTIPMSSTTVQWDFNALSNKELSERALDLYSRLQSMAKGTEARAQIKAKYLAMHKESQTRKTG